MSNQARKPAENSDKRASVLEQAIVVFAERGFRGTDVQVIADRARVGKGTVYRYFGNKEELFWATLHEVMGRIERAVFAAVEKSESLQEGIRATCLAYASVFEGHRDYLELFVQRRVEFRGNVPELIKRHGEMMIAHFCQIIQKDIDQGKVRPGNVRKMVILLGDMLHGVIDGHLDEGNPHGDFSLSEMAAAVADVFLRGIQAGGVEGYADVTENTRVTEKTEPIGRLGAVENNEIVDCNGPHDPIGPHGFNESAGPDRMAVTDDANRSNESESTGGMKP